VGGSGGDDFVEPFGSQLETVAFLVGVESQPQRDQHLVDRGSIDFDRKPARAAGHVSHFGKLGHTHDLPSHLSDAFGALSTVRHPSYALKIHHGRGDFKSFESLFQRRGKRRLTLPPAPPRISTSPPPRRASSRAMGRPSPVPPPARAGPESAGRDRSKTVESAPGGNPGPASDTTTRTHPSTASVPTSTSVPEGA